MKRNLLVLFAALAWINMGAASDYVRQTTWSTGDLITANKLNADPDETARIFGTNSNGIIANGNIASGAAIAESKIAFSTTGHDHDGTDDAWIVDGQAKLSHVTSNIWTIGDGNDVDHRFRVNNGDAALPEIRYNATDSDWEFSNDGSTFTNISAAISQAVQADIEAETNEDTYIPPDLVKHSPGAAKAWCSILAAGTLESPSYNVTSVTDTGTGDRTIVWATDFSGAVYVMAASVMQDTEVFPHFDSLAVGSVRHAITNSSSTLVDIATAVAAFGDQ